ncbi:MAG: DUF402 domain-containing protein [Blastocatellia bacterium]|nr:DUF402 domain-containing protein [Blastocatellia bacterium]
MDQTIITVNSRKFDRSISRTWTCELVEADESLITLLGVFTFDVSHPNLGAIAQGTVSYEYFWQDRWYNVFRFHNPDGSLRNWYCNICMPPEFVGTTLDYIDLDIDIVIWPDGTREVLDRDEFAANAAAFKYPADIINNAETALSDVLAMIDNAEFPFS